MQNQNKQTKQNKTIAYNPLTKKMETVYHEDELDGQATVTMFWSQSLRRWVTIPE